jgi:hypothetical protein
MKTWTVTTVRGAARRGRNPRSPTRPRSRDNVGPSTTLRSPRDALRARHNLVARSRAAAGRKGWRAAVPFSREEQFRLLEAALEIQLEMEGKPKDAITLRRPADLPVPWGTPERRPRRGSVLAADRSSVQGATRA